MTGRPVAALGVDIGGSHVLALSQDRAGRLLHTSGRPRDPAGGAPGMLRAVAEAVGEVRRAPGSDRWPVGIAFPGAFEGRDGRVIYAPNLPEWKGLRARRTFSDLLGVRVVLENDANAAAWAEYELGPGGPRDLLYVSLGTGIGSGLVLEGALHRGPWGLSGEIGHVRIEGATGRCGCGKVGCLESVAGGAGLARACRRLARDRPRSQLGRMVASDGEASAKQLLLAAERGDLYARRWRDAAGVACGSVIGSAVNVVGVPRVVLGGRLLHRAPGYARAMLRGIHGALLPPLVPRVRVVRSVHWQHRGAQGALLLAMGHERSKARRSSRA